MDANRDDNLSPELTPDLSYAADSQYLAAEDYPRMLSNQPSDLGELLDESSSDASYADGEYYYGKDDSGSAA
jgi:hypothetical protein